MHLYREWAPPAGWGRTVACRWEQRVGAPRRHRVVPDGCADVVVGLPGGPVVAGTADEAALHDLATGTHILGVRLRPAAVRTVLGVDADELRNRSVPLDDVVGSARARRLVDAAVAGADEPSLREEPPALVTRAVALLERGSVDATAGALGLSGRHLRRVLLAEVGLGPKALQRVLRLQRFLAAGGDLAGAAAAAGYADQPHLTREVRRLTGLTPARLLAERAGGD